MIVKVEIVKGNDKRQNKLYIATPINARPEQTLKEKLFAAKQRIEMLKENLANDIRFKDYEMISTFDLPHDDDCSEASAVGKCVTAVMESDAVYLDCGWEKSNGCRVEYRTAQIYGKQIYKYNELS